MKNGGSFNSYVTNYQRVSYFTNLNLAAIKGDDAPYKNHDSRYSRLREDSEVVKFTQVYIYIYKYIYICNY